MSQNNTTQNNSTQKIHPQLMKLVTAANAYALDVNADELYIGPAAFKTRNDETGLLEAEALIEKLVERATEDSANQYGKFLVKSFENYKQFLLKKNEINPVAEAKAKVKATMEQAKEAIRQDLNALKRTKSFWKAELKALRNTVKAAKRLAAADRKATADAKKAAKLERQQAKIQAQAPAEPAVNQAQALVASRKGKTAK